MTLNIYYEPSISFGAKSVVTGARLPLFEFDGIRQIHRANGYIQPKHRVETADFFCGGSAHAYKLETNTTMKKPFRIAIAIVVGLVSFQIVEGILYSPGAVAQAAGANESTESTNSKHSTTSSKSKNSTPSTELAEYVSPADFAGSADPAKTASAASKAAEKSAVKEKIQRRIRMAFHRQTHPSNVTDGHHLKRLESDTGHHNMSNWRDNCWD